MSDPGGYDPRRSDPFGYGGRGVPPRNVSPDPSGWGPTNGPPGAGAWRTWSVDVSGRPVPILGIVLLLVGIGLFVEMLIPELSFLTLVILAAGIALAFAWLARGVIGATVPALVLCGWALARLGEEMGLLPGGGWTLLFVGLALIAAWAIGRSQGAPRDWALWVGAIVGIIGLADASDVLGIALDLAIIVPLAIIGLGVVLIYRGRFSLR